MSYALSVYSPKKLVLIDGDKIERSNLNRQFLFTINDIGKYKSEVIADALKLRNPNLDIEVYTEFISTNNINNILEGKDTNSMFGILSGDDDTAVSISSKYFLTNNVPFVNIGYLNDIAVISPLLFLTKLLVLSVMEHFQSTARLILMMKQWHSCINNMPHHQVLLIIH